jgi:hypothetical protein
MSDFSSGRDYLIIPGANGALDVPGWAGEITTKEWMAGQINHALYLNVACLASSTTVFPDVSGPASVCNIAGNPKPNTNRPLLGNMIFLDYTDAQINSMNLHAWQKPIIMALAHYGGYIGDTGNGNGSIAPVRVEGNQAYAQAGTVNPIYAWLAPQAGVQTQGAPGGALKYQVTLFAGIPNLTGPSCATACNYVGHLHIADPCVSKGLVGVSGGCP